MKALVLVLATVLLAGCGGVECENPASDAATTKVDERLIGFWKIDLKASGVADDSFKMNEGLFAIGKEPGESGGLTLVALSLDEGVLKVERPSIRATTIEARAYVSVQSPPEGESKTGRWTVLRYEVPEEGTLRVVLMNEDEVAKDVRAGKVPGSVKEPKPGSTGEPTMVTLSATVAALRTYLGARSDAVFKADKPLVLKRVNLR